MTSDQKPTPEELEAMQLAAEERRKKGEVEPIQIKVVEKPREAPNPLTQGEKQAALVAKEILTSEKTYREVLSSMRPPTGPLYQRILALSADPGLLLPSNSRFRPIQRALQVSAIQKLLKEMKKLLEQLPKICEAEEAFYQSLTKHGWTNNTFRLLNAYITSTIPYMQLFDVVKNVGPDVQTIINADPGIMAATKNLGMLGSAITVVQRGPRYLLLLSELAKALPPHQDIGRFTAEDLQKSGKVFESPEIARELTAIFSNPGLLQTLTENIDKTRQTLLAANNALKQDATRQAPYRIMTEKYDSLMSGRDRSFEDPEMPPQKPPKPQKSETPPPKPPKPQKPAKPEAVLNKPEKPPKPPKHIEVIEEYDQPERGSPPKSPRK